MKYYIKIINNRPIIKAGKDIIIKNNGLCTYNPNEEMILSDGWEDYSEALPEPSEDELLALAKEGKIAEIKEYDNSSEVNNCVVMTDAGSLNYWANKLERDSLKGAVLDCIKMGRDSYRLDLRDFGICLTIPCETLINMLCALEVYAIDCYNKTTDHIYAVNALETIEDVENYQFKGVGYPPVLIFTV